jgi:hypothetical protein
MELATFVKIDLRLSTDKPEDPLYFSLNSFSLSKSENPEADMRLRTKLPRIVGKLCFSGLLPSQ